MLSGLAEGWRDAMPGGPLPNRTRRRRNTPTIPTTNLPAEGREGPIPRSPVKLGAAGRKWWRWAWQLPQAAAWSDGDVMFAARRARLEDDLAALDGFEVEELSADELRRIARLAAGAMSVSKQMTELDDRLGMTPRARQQLRWEIVETEAPAPLAVVADERWRNAGAG